MSSKRFDRLPRLVLPDGLIVSEAVTWRVRLLGLALLDDLPPHQALLFPRCRSVHTFGMRFPIDVAFLDRDGELVRLVTAAGARRTLSARGARAVLETPAGQAERFIEASVSGLVTT